MWTKQSVHFVLKQPLLFNFTSWLHPQIIDILKAGCPSLVAQSFGWKFSWSVVFKNNFPRTSRWSPRCVKPLQFFFNSSSRWIFLLFFFSFYNSRSVFRYFLAYIALSLILFFVPSNFQYLVDQFQFYLILSKSFKLILIVFYKTRWLQKKLFACVLVLRSFTVSFANETPSSLEMGWETVSS